MLEQVRFRGNRFGKTRGSFVFGATARRDAVFQDFVLEHLSFGPNQDGNLPRLQTFDDSAIQNWVLDSVVVDGSPINDDSSFGELGGGVSKLLYQPTEPQIVTVHAEDLWVSENGELGRFVIKRSGNLDESLVASFTLSGSGKEGTHFKSVGDSCTFESGQAECPIEIAPIPNSDKQQITSVVVKITNTHGSDYIIGPDYIASIAIDKRAVSVGDINRDCQVNLLDVQPFILLLSTNQYQIEADINEDGDVNLLDVGPLVALLSGS